MNPKNILRMFLFPLLFLMSLLLFSIFNSNNKVQTLAYSDLFKEIDKATIQKIVFYKDGRVGGEFKSPQNEKKYFVSDIGEGDSAFLSRKLESQNPRPEIIKQNKTPSFWLMLAGWLPMIIIIGFFLYMAQKMNPNNSRSGGLGGFMKSKVKQQDGSKQITFKDVAGADEAKEELKEIVDFLGDPGKFTKLGGRIPKGVLLVGSPGVGKTLLAGAVAGEARVPFFSISGSDFVEMFVGVGARRVRDLFETGKKNTPCIIFIDELDAIGKHRGTGIGGGNDEREQTLNALLVEMDGFETNAGVIIISATNRPDVLDPALLRPGRFDRQIVMGKPDIKGRREILKIHSGKIPTDTDVDLGILAKGTPGFTGADLANLCNEAALNAGKHNKKIVDMNDFEFAKDKVMMGSQRSIIISPKEKYVTAIHETGHAMVASIVPEADPIHKVTIIPRGLSLGSTWQLPEADHHNYSKTYLKSQLAILMAGRCAEELIFKEYSTGASNDIERATEISREMVCSWGMSDKLGPLKFGTKNDSPFLGKQLAGTSPDYSQDTAQQVDEEMKKLVVEAQIMATQILSCRMSVLREMAQVLIEKETITGEDVKKMLNQDPL
ncbi:MAG TPA: ATP-dependent zinc metalloprotease FtsH [Candidatus Paceibacterota bacterium]